MSFVSLRLRPRFSHVAWFYSAIRPRTNSLIYFNPTGCVTALFDFSSPLHLMLSYTMIFIIFCTFYGKKLINYADVKENYINFTLIFIINKFILVRGVYSFNYNINYLTLCSSSNIVYLHKSTSTSFNIFLNIFLFLFFKSIYLLSNLFHLRCNKKNLLLFSFFSLFFYSPTSSGTHEKSEQLERKAKAFIWQPDQW